MLHTLSFLALAALAALFALATLVFPNMIHAFLAFMGCLLCVAGVYFSLQADFIGAAQVIVYAGSVAILIVLALLLINRRQGDLAHTNRWAHKWLGGALAALAVGGCITGVLLYTMYTGWPLAGETAAVQPLPYTELADGLLNQYVVAFEAMAVLLLAALVAAIITAREPEPEETQNGQD